MFRVVIIQERPGSMLHLLSHGRCHKVEWIPSGEHTKNNGTSPFFMGKSTIHGHCYVSSPEGINRDSKCSTTRRSWSTRLLDLYLRNWRIVFQSPSQSSMVASRAYLFPCGQEDVFEFSFNVTLLWRQPVHSLYISGPSSNPQDAT